MGFGAGHGITSGVTISDSIGAGGDLISFNPSSVSLDAGSRLRVSQITTLADLKILDQDDLLLTENLGTGTGLFENNTFLMSVDPGEYQIKCSKHYYHYFSGKSQMIETTFDGFHSESGIIKRVGYFSSNEIAPYNSNLDGFYLENKDNNIYLVVTNHATETLRKPISEFDNYYMIKDYDWSKFTVLLFDYLWLGGAVLRLFLKTDKGFVLCHTFNYSGTSQGTFTRSPNHKIRYEIRSTTGTGSFRYICSQVSTEGSISENGKQRSVNTGHLGISLANVGTTYPIKAIRKKLTCRDKIVKQIGMGVYVSSNSDALLVTLQLNPTFSAPLTYTAVSNSSAEEANGNGTITISTNGTILWSNIIYQNVILPPNVLENDFLSSLGVTLNNVSDELVLCATPITASVTCYGIMGFKEY